MSMLCSIHNIELVKCKRLTIGKMSDKQFRYFFCSVKACNESKNLGNRIHIGNYNLIRSVQICPKCKTIE